MKAVIVQHANISKLANMKKKALNRLTEITELIYSIPTVLFCDINIMDSVNWCQYTLRLSNIL